MVPLELVLFCCLCLSNVKAAASSTLPTNSTPSQEDNVGNCVAGGSAYGLYFDFTRADVVSLRWTNMPVQENTVEFWYRSTDRHQNLHNIFGYSAYDPDYAGRPGVNGNRPFLYDQPNEFQLHFTPSYIMVWRGENRVLLSREINPRVGEAYQDLEWHHYAFVYSSNYLGTGRPLQQIYLDGHHLDFGSTRIEDVPNYFKAPFSNDFDVAEHEDAEDYYGTHNCSVALIDNPCQQDAADKFDAATVALLHRSGHCSDYEQALRSAQRGAWAVIFQLEEEQDSTGFPDVQWDQWSANGTKLPLPVIAVDFAVGEQLRSKGFTAFHRNRDPMDLGPNFGRPIERKGLLTVGQEPDAHAGDFAPFQAANGILDEFRVWDTVRTPEQVLSKYLRYIDVKSDPEAKHLSVYWTFDDMMVNEERETASSKETGGVGYLVQDLSPNGANPGLVGALVNGDHLTYVGEPSRPPRAPDTIPTTSSPLVGKGDVIVAIAPNQSVMLDLKSFDPEGDDLTTTILSLPEVGMLTDMNEKPLFSGDVVIDEERSANKRVLFKAPENFTEDTAFLYAVSDGGTPVAATVRLVPHSLSIPQQAPITTITEDSLTFFALALPSQLTQKNMKVIITSLPARGSLYQAQFKPGTDETYDSLAKEVDQYGPMERITRTGTVLSTERGIVMYAPNENEHSDPAGSIYASFMYKLTDDVSRLSSDEIACSIIVEAVNDAPMPHSSTAHATSSNGTKQPSVTILKLESADIDPNSNARAIHRIVKFPSGGRLYQYNESNEHNLGEYIDNLKPWQPMSFAWASRVVRFSSHFSLCGRECYSWSHPECKSNDVRSGFPINGTCTQTAFHASNILGPHDLYPEYGNSRLSWVASKENAGFEFIELEFDAALFITDVNVYLPYKPGALWKVSTAAEYADDLSTGCTRPGEPDVPECSQDTEWMTLWSKPPETVSHLADNSIDFHPPVCPVFRKTKLLRIDLNTERAPGWNHIDAVKISGTLELQPGVVEDPLSRLVYVPLVGIHGRDTLSFVSSDCGREGEEGTVTVTIEAPEDGGFSATAISYDQIEVEAVPGQIVEHEVDLSSALLEMEQTIGAPITNTSATVWHSDVLGLPIGRSVSSLSPQAPVVALPVSVPGYGRPFSRFELWLQPASSTLTFRVHFDVFLKVDCVNGNVEVDSGRCRCWTPRWEGNDCTQEVAEDMNDVSVGFVIVASCAYAILLVTCVGLSVVVYRNTDKLCIRVSQPFYLYVLLFGCLLTATAIPLLVQSSDAACAATYWCFFLGFSLMMGALYAKILRAYKVFRTGLAMRRKEVSVMETAHIILALVVVHAVILTLWMVMDAPYWQRTVLETDGEGYVLSTVGECRSTLESPYLVSLLCLNIALMCLAGFVCYKVRNIPDKFQESSSVAIAVFTIANIYIIGIPVLILVEENPEVRLYISSGIVFLVVAIVISLIFGNLLSLLFFRSEESVASSIKNHIRNQSFTHRIRKSRMHDVSELSFPSSHAPKQQSHLTLDTPSVILEGDSTNGNTDHKADSALLEATKCARVPESQKLWSSLDEAMTEWDSLLRANPDVLQQEDASGMISTIVIPKLEALLDAMKSHNQSCGKNRMNDGVSSLGDVDADSNSLDTNNDEGEP